MRRWRSWNGPVLVLLAASCAAPALVEEAPGPPVAPAPAAELPSFLADTVAAIGADYAPDRRVARFQVEAGPGDGAADVVLEGVTDQPGAHARLIRALEARDVAFLDRIRTLPALEPGEPGWALVTISVANLRTEPSHSAELATQATLGTPLRVLDRNGGWTLVQVPDGYLAWVDAGGIERVTRDELEAHRAADRIIYLEASGTAWSEPVVGSTPVSDLVAGDILVLEDERAGFFRVRFPDGREAYVATAEADRYDLWLAGLEPTEAGLVATATALLGRPYLWGGTSPKAMDCSGFTKTVYFLNGMVLPRDASQQVHAGLPVDDAGDFSNLRPGDLLFFGRPGIEDRPERVVHVGMWIGDGRFIHSSGRVRISGMDPADPLYDAYNRRRYLRTKRVVGHLDGVHLLTDGALYPVNGRFAPAATAGPAVRRSAGPP